jgi:cytochrome c2
MKITVSFLALTLFLGSTAMAADPNDPKEYQEIIEKRCSICHNHERIEEAIKSGQNMNQILNKMMAMGATLTEQEKKVLGTFWGSPTKN